MTSPNFSNARHVYLHARTAKGVLVFLFAVLATLANAAPATTEIDPWKPSGTIYYIKGLPRLILGFTDQTGAATTALVSSLHPEQLAGMPDGLVQAKDSDIFTPGHFQALWNAMKAGVCDDIQKSILKLVNNPPNSAYNPLPCVLNSQGYLLANFQEGWTNDSMQSVTGRRIRFDYLVPFNAVIFWVTSPHTCHLGSNCPTEPTDPAFSMVFNLDITVTCTSSQPDAFTLPATCTPAASVDVEAVYGGDVTAQLTAAATKFAAQLAAEGAATAASGGAAAPEAVAGAIAGAINVAIKGIGAAIAAATDEHLRDQVSAALVGYVSSPTLGANAQSVNSDFTTLFNNLYFADLGGLKPFVIRFETPGWDLDFGLVYPLPAKPLLENTTAASNKGSLFSPQIAVSKPEVIAGQTIPVKCTDFRGAYVNSLSIAWNKTVLGTQRSKLGWGPPDQVVTIPALTFYATNLKPATMYQFVVKECDGLTCAPKSDVLTTVTEGAGASDVRFWLDNSTNQIIGQAAIGNNAYSFSANVTIPAGTTAGTHVLNALEVGTQVATVAITVCPVSGCGPVIGVFSTQSNTFYPPGSLVGTGNPVVVRGSKFAPGGSVWLWLDGVKGTRVATAPVGPLGNFQASFSMPMTHSGQHQFVAIELKPGVKLPPVQKGKTPVIPPQDFVIAAVAINVAPPVQ